MSLQLTDLGKVNCHFLDYIDKLAVKNLPDLLWMKKVFALLYYERMFQSVESKRCEAATNELANDRLVM